MFGTIFRKVWPYLLIATIGLAIYGGFRYYTNKIETLTTEKANLQTQLSQTNANYTTLQNMYKISIDQSKELEKQQKESLDYTNRLEKALNEISLKKYYDEDSAKLLNNINEYEKCYSLYTIKNPYKHCYQEK